MGVRESVDSSYKKGTANDAVVENYVKQGNNFKLSKEWDQAGISFKKAAEEKMKGRQEGSAAGSLFENAAKCFINAKNIKEAGNCAEQATKIFNENGNFAQSAKLLEDLSALYEKQENIEEALHSLQKAADCYEADSLPLARKDSLVKLAECQCKYKRYSEAAQIYEDIATSLLTNELMRSRLIEYWFLALFCKVGVNDLVNCKQSLEKYRLLQPEFTRMREDRFMQTLLNCWESNEAEKIQENCQNFQKITPFLDWQLVILQDLQKRLTEDDLT